MRHGEKVLAQKQVFIPVPVEVGDIGGERGCILGLFGERTKFEPGAAIEEHGGRQMADLDLFQGGVGLFEDAGDVAATRDDRSRNPGS